MVQRTNSSTFFLSCLCLCVSVSLGLFPFLPLFLSFSLSLSLSLSVCVCVCVCIAATQLVSVSLCKSSSSSRVAMNPDPAFEFQAPTWCDLQESSPAKSPSRADWITRLGYPAPSFILYFPGRWVLPHQQLTPSPSSPFTRVSLPSVSASTPTLPIPPCPSYGRTGGPGWQKMCADTKRGSGSPTWSMSSWMRMADQCTKPQNHC